MSERNIKVTQHVGEVKEGGTVIGVQVIYQNEPVLIPSPEDIQLHCADLTKIANYNRWADEFYIREESKVLPLYSSPYEDNTGLQREELLQAIRSHRRLLVLGEPGIGKTVAMERMMWETAQSSELVVPILVQLLYFLGTDLVESIRVALGETRRLNFENLKSVRAFLRETKCLILFDGLNEVPGRQREQVIGAIANFMREYPEHRYVVTSRSQDELWRKLRSSELIRDAVVIQNISDAQAQDYLEAHFGKKIGQALYHQLDDALKALARTPLLLKLIRDAGQRSDQLPRNRGELFDKFVMNRLLEREQKLELVESPEIKKKGLAYLAFELQLVHQLAFEREWAEKVLVGKGLGNKTNTILNEALLHGLLLQQNLPDKQCLHFIHQSVQEYFVAMKLLTEIQAERRGSLLQKAIRQISNRTLTSWAKDYWWNESFVQLAGLVEDADWLARRVMNVNPWLAWWCVEEGQDVQDDTRNMIEARSIKMLNSERVTERRRAVQTLGQIKNERVIEPLLIAAGDDDQEVAGMSIQALIEMGDSAQSLILQKLRSTVEADRRIALSYLAWQPEDAFCVKLLSELLGMPMVRVSTASFLMGKDENKAADSYDRKFPQRSVTLPGYWIGRYPVTVAQWRVFVKETGHEARKESLQNPDDHPVCYITWDGAGAYCKWLSDKSELAVTLPSEEEWEKAARGTDGRIYPWGNQFSKDKCNTLESGIGKTTPVGKYSPLGDSPYGCADMAGNVWEWTRSEYMPPDHRIVVRGGSWNSAHNAARGSYRTYGNPYFDHFDDGFRIVARLHSR